MEKLYMLEKNKLHFWVCKYGAGFYTIDRITSGFGGTVKAADTLEEIEKYAAENGFILLKSSIMNICDIKPALEKLEALETVADAAEEEMMNDIMSTEKEKAFDEAYKAQYECFMNISCALVELSGGKITIADARAMVNGKREKLKQIF